MTDSPATDLVPAAPRHGATYAHRMDAPLPGSYWRLREAIEERVRTNRMVAPAMPAGTVLMLASVEMADGQAHAYGFAPHPNWADAFKVEFHADDFYRHWEPCPDGQAVRAGELQLLLDEMEQTKALMMQPPPGATPAGLLCHDPSTDVGAPGQALVTVDQINAMTIHAQRMKEDAERHSEWISTHSKSLSAQGTRMANFHQERAQAALARAKSQLDSVATILKTVTNLRIYTGDDLSVDLLRDGAPAAADVPLTIYQEVLSLDEETLILLDQGGLDHTQTDSLLQALEDPALLTRLIPAERGVVLARFRNNYKEFIKEKGDVARQVAARRYNHEMSEESKRKRLLVRDGERLYLIDADEILRPIKQLLPSAAEQDGYYTRKPKWHREEPTRITRDDLDYAAAQREQLGALDHYGQVLIMLWGLRDRGVLFDASALPRFANWLDPSFMDRHLRLVSIDTMLAITRPGYAQWRHAQNAYLAKGSWVAVQLAAVMNADDCPGAFTRGRYYGGRTHYESLYRPNLAQGEGVLIARAQHDKQGFYVEVPAVYCGYNRNVTRREVMLRAAISEGANQQPIKEMLVLDRVRASDMTYYLESREQRRSYRDYVELFQVARRWVRERDESEDPLRAELRQALVSADLRYDPDALDDHLTDALAIARTSRRDGKAPAPGSASHRAYVTTALNALHAAISDHSSRVDAIQHWADVHGRQPLRLALSGKDGWLLYLIPNEAEHDPRLGPVSHASVATIDFGPDEPLVVHTGRRLLRAVSGEQVIHDWEWDVPATPPRFGHLDPDAPTVRPAGATHWLNLSPAFSLPYEDAAALIEGLWQQGQERLDWQRATPPLDQVAAASRYMHEHSRGTVQRETLKVPVGAIIRGGKPHVLLACLDTLHHAYAKGDALVKAAVRAAVGRIYAQPMHAVVALETPPDVGLVLATLDTYSAWLKRGGVIESGRWITTNDILQPEKPMGGRESTVLTAITGATRELAPELLPLVRDVSMVFDEPGT